jgi:hypothetical protein
VAGVNVIGDYIVACCVGAVLGMCARSIYREWQARRRERDREQLGVGGRGVKR